MSVRRRARMGARVAGDDRARIDAPVRGDDVRRPSRVVGTVTESVRIATCAAVGAILLAAACVVGACGPDSASNTGPCDGKNRPAFRVSFVTEAPSLPADLVVSVRYSGGLDEFRFADPDPSPNVVFCEHVVPGSGSSDGGAEGGDGGGATPTEDAGSGAIVCELWTNGAATLEATGTGFLSVKRALDAEFDEVCDEVVTTDVTIVLLPR